MIKTTDMLLDELSDYANPEMKLSRMVQQGAVFPIVRGLYETDRHAPPAALAGSIYGPSYVSFDYARSAYGLIPEAVRMVTSATFDKKKKKRYETPFGVFTYRDVPRAAFPLALVVQQEGDYYYRMASPEKALCDKLYTLPPQPGQKALAVCLAEDLRIDEAALRALDAALVETLAARYRATNVRNLAALLRRLAK